MTDTPPPAAGDANGHATQRDIENAEPMLEVTPASAWAERFEKTYVRELSPGFNARIRKLPLTSELLRGSLPNQVLRRIRMDLAPYLDDRDEAERQKENYEAALPILARGMVEPKFIYDSTGKRKADRKKGEVDETMMTYIEVDNAYFYIVKEVIPPEESAPFRTPRDERQGTGEDRPSGTTLPPDSPSVPGTGG